MKSSIIVNTSEVPKILYQIYDELYNYKNEKTLNNELYDCLILKMDLEKSKTIIDKILAHTPKSFTPKCHCVYYFFVRFITPLFPFF